MSYPGEKRDQQPQQAPPVYMQHPQAPQQQQGVYNPMPPMQQPQIVVPQYYQQGEQQQHVYMNPMQVQSMPSFYQQQPVMHQPSPVPMSQLPVQPQMLYMAQPTYMGQAPLQHAMVAGMPSVPPIIPGIKPSRRIIATIIHALIAFCCFCDIIFNLASGVYMHSFADACTCIILCIARAALIWVSWCAIREPAFLLRPFKEMKKVFAIVLMAIIALLLALAYIVPVFAVPVIIFGSLYLYGITRGLDPESRVGYFCIPFRPFGLQ